MSQWKSSRNTLGNPRRQAIDPKRIVSIHLKVTENDVLTIDQLVLLCMTDMTDGRRFETNDVFLLGRRGSCRIERREIRRKSSGLGSLTLRSINGDMKNSNNCRMAPVRPCSRRSGRLDPHRAGDAVWSLDVERIRPSRLRL
jgi:hypothetical protein